MARHGLSAYTYNRCRCDVCRAAMAAYRRDLRQRVRGKVPPEVPHGLASTQENYGCRCRSCREACNAKARAYYWGKREEEASTT